MRRDISCAAPALLATLPLASLLTCVGVTRFLLAAQSSSGDSPLARIIGAGRSDSSGRVWAACRHDEGLRQAKGRFAAETEKQRDEPTTTASGHKHASKVEMVRSVRD